MTAHFSRSSGFYDLHYIVPAAVAHSRSSMMRVGLCLWGLSDLEVSGWLKRMPVLDGRLSWTIVRDMEASGCDMAIHLVVPSRSDPRALCWNSLGANARMQRDRTSGRQSIALYAGHATSMTMHRQGCWVAGGLRPMQEALMILVHAVVVPGVLRHVEARGADGSRNCLPFQLSSSNATCALAYLHVSTSTALAAQASQLLRDSWRAAMIKPYMAVVTEVRGIDGPSGLRRSEIVVPEGLQVEQNFSLVSGVGSHLFVMFAFPWFSL